MTGPLNATAIQCVTKIREVGISQHRGNPKEAFSLHRTFGLPLETDVRPPRNGVERPRPLTQTSEADWTDFTSQRQNESDRPQTSDSSTNQMVFHGLPSNVHTLGSLERKICLILQQY